MTQKSAITTNQAPAPGGAYSQAIVVGNLVWVAGQVGKDPASGTLPPTVEEQVELAIVNLGRVLEASGCGLQDVVKTTCFLTDIADFSTFDQIYRRLFPEPWPARSTVGVSLAGELKFEIEAWAVKPGDDW